MKYKKWFFMFPGDSYPLDKTFDKPVAEKEAREFARKFDGVKRLPKDFQCWPKGEEIYA